MRKREGSLREYYMLMAFVLSYEFGTWAPVMIGAAYCI